jgi:hypothetical protein
MKNFAKLSVLGIFALFCFVWMVNGLASAPGYRVRAQAQPTPPANTAANTAANMALVNGNSSNRAAPVTNTNSSNTAVMPANTATPAPAGGASIPASFTLNQGSASAVYGEVAFNHENHASKLYSPDGKSTIGCTVCHHTDQPKSELKPPLQTSERSVVLTLESWKVSSQKVNNCRTCHFQEGADIPDGKEMPKIGDKEYTNENAYHDNCNVCHDAAAKARKELLGKPGFATTTGCTICHKKNE